MLAKKTKKNVRERGGRERRERQRDRETERVWKSDKNLSKLIFVYDWTLDR